MGLMCEFMSHKSWSSSTEWLPTSGKIVAIRPHDDVLARISKDYSFSFRMWKQGVVLLGPREHLGT